MSGRYVNGAAADVEDQPLLHAIPKATVRKSWTLVVLIMLVLVWCITDSWNHDVSSQLSEFQQFSFPITLAFTQFLFMSVAFSLLWFSLSEDRVDDIRKVKDQMSSDSSMAGLGLTHVFGTYCLQSMVLPMQMMSIGVFAATRAVEIPATLGMRKMILGKHQLPGGQSPFTAGAMFASAWILFFSYMQMANCLCVWSGHGLALSGVALYLVYALVLTLPAANAVYQEAVIVKLDIPPALMLLAQNVMACLVCIPFMGLAHMAGMEDIGLAWHTLRGHPEVSMSVLWLCVQMTLMSIACCGVISMVGSFWAVSAHSFRVVYWWFRQLMHFYGVSNVALSVARPHASIWSLVMITGIILAGASFAYDRPGAEPVKDVSTKRKPGYQAA